VTTRAGVGKTSAARRNGGPEMRFIQGIIVGALLMVGSAYLHDTGILQSSGDKTPPPPAFVNWDTVLGMIGR
jgi:hypothetical protein